MANSDGLTIGFLYEDRGKLKRALNDEGLVCFTDPGGRLKVCTSDGFAIPSILGPAVMGGVRHGTQAPEPQFVGG